MMKFSEEALTFHCDGELMLGVVSVPHRCSAMGVVIVVGGPQYRCGSHRQFVQLARFLAANGYAVLRFDLRGMGDSTGNLTHFEAAGPDLRAAIDALMRHRAGLQSVALWGLCDGASAALLYLDQRQDSRVRALLLVNPWVRSVATLARTHLKHYYLKRLVEREFWLKLFKGGVGLQAIGQLGDKLRSVLMGERGQANDALDFVGRMARACVGFHGPILVALSENDYTAREFDELALGSTTWKAIMSRENVTRLNFADADHTFSAKAAREALEVATLRHLGQIGGVAA